MFQSYYHLREQPFGVNPDPRFLYLSKKHREAFSSLLYRLQVDSGFLAMIAPPGMGKTTLLFHLLHRLRGTAKTAFIFQTQCTSNELLRNLLSEFECDTSATDSGQMFRELKSTLVTESNAGRRCVVIIDEAQNLSSEVLETIRLLSNFETPRRKLLNIVLSGQTELDDVLSRAGLRQLRQRMSCIAYLQQFTPAETALYIAHRLEVAGFTGKVSDLFSIPSLVQIAHLSQGVPRVINNICFNALSLGFALESKQIDSPIIDEVAVDLGMAPLQRPHLWQAAEAYTPEAKKALSRADDHHSDPESDILSAVSAYHEENASRSKESEQVNYSAVATLASHYDQTIPQSHQEESANCSKEAEPAHYSAAAPLASHYEQKNPQSTISDLSSKAPDPIAPPQKARRLIVQTAVTPHPAKEAPIASPATGEHRGSRSPFLLRSVVCILVLCVAPVTAIQLRRTISAQAAAEQPSSPTDDQLGKAAIPETAPSAKPISSTAKSRSSHTHRRNHNGVDHLLKDHHSGMPVDLTLATFAPEPLIKPVSLPTFVESTVIRSGQHPGSAPAIAANAPLTAQRPQAHSRYTPPQPIWQPAPKYRSIGRQKVTGKDVQLMLSISSDGSVYKAELLKGSGKLALAAQRAVRQWKYSPAISNGVPVDSRVYVTIQFQQQ